MSEGRFASPSDLAQVLSQNVVYFRPKGDNSGLLVVNKPAGVPLKTSEDGQIGMNEAMPELAEKLKVKKIHVVKSVQRHASGCAILCTRDQGVSQVQRSLKRQSGFDRILGQTYFALCCGIPRKTNVIETVDIGYENIREEKSLMSDMNKNKEPVINRIIASRTGLKKDREKTKNKIKRVSVEMDTLSKGEDGRVSLIKIEPTSTDQSFLQIYSADMLSPIIGDHIYGYRAKLFMNKMVRVSPQKSPDSNASVQNLPEWIPNKLGLQVHEESLIPLHLHLGRIHLPGFFGQNNHLTIHAPPRPYFLGTADFLGIKYDFENIMQDNDIRQYIPVQQKKKFPKHGIEILTPDDINSDNEFNQKYLDMICEDENAENLK